MKIHKLFAFGALVLSSLALVSCSDDDNYSAGEVDNGAYLYAAKTSLTFTPEETQSFTIQVGRTAGEAASAGSVKVTGDNAAFTFAENVNFTAGQEKADLTVTCNIPAGESETITFALPKESATAYGNDSLTVTVKCDYNWVSAGRGTFVENTFSGASATVNVQHASGTNIYRLVNPFVAVAKAGGDLGGTPGNVNLQFEMDETGAVKFADGIYDLVPGTENAAYQMYFNTARYAQYCSFTNEDGLLTWSFLLLNSGKLYTGGELIFEWTTGYPVE
jgi:hypothetical protein